MSLLRELDRRNPPVVEVDHVDGAGLASGLQHLASLVEAVGERLLAEHVLAGFEGGQHHILVGVAGSGNIHQADIVAFDQRVIVGLDALPAQADRPRAAVASRSRPQMARITGFGSTSKKWATCR